MRTALIAALLATSLPARALSPGLPSYVLLDRLVGINTSTDNVDGLEEARSVLVSAFEALGLKTRRFDVGDGHAVLAFEAERAQPAVLLLGHLDTVFKRGSPFQGLHEDGGKLRGPGVIDMKGGLVLMRDVAAALKEKGLLGHVRLVIDDEEETGSTRSKARLAELAEGIRDVLVFEPGLPDGAVVTSESGVRWLKLTVTGRAAHAGLEPEKGLNACVELAEKVAHAARLTNLERRLTVNVGVLEGGTKPNVVCERATATLDVRYKEKDDLAKTLAALDAIRENSYTRNVPPGLSYSATLEHIAEMPSFDAAASRDLYAAVQRAARRLGQSVPARHVGYASDGNHLALAHRVIAGLGPYGGGLHTDGEFMAPQAFEARLGLTLELLGELIADHQMETK